MLVWIPSIVLSVSISWTSYYLFSEWDICRSIRFLTVQAKAPVVAPTGRYQLQKDMNFLTQHFGCENGKFGGRLRSIKFGRTFHLQSMFCRVLRQHAWVTLAVKGCIQRLSQFMQRKQCNTVYIWHINIYIYIRHYPRLFLCMASCKQGP